MVRWLFPHHMRSVQESPYPYVLFLYRLFAYATIVCLVVHYFIVDSSFISFIYLTEWGMILTAIFFTLALASERFRKVDKAASLFFNIIWAFNWCITVAFWGYLFPICTCADMTQAILRHSVPIILTLVDFSLNRITFVRAQYIIAVSLLLIYGVCVLMPYTLMREPVYDGIDFNGWVTYAFSVGLPLFSVVMLEIGKVVRETIEKSSKSDKEHNLIDSS
jgi:hypothetical protein